MMRRFVIAGLGVLACAWWYTASGAEGDGKKPAVLFVGGVHAKYAAKPLADMGIAVDTCESKDLAAKLESGKYNVAVVSTPGDAERKTLDAFLAKGGGVFACNPNAYPDDKAWTGTCEWLAGMGARTRWELLADTDEKNVVRDIMGSALSFSDQVSGPANKGVKGVLTLTSGSTTGWEPPMSFDFGAGWTVVVRGARSMKTVIETRNDVPLQAWIPKKAVDQSPALMGIRDVGKGRLAVVGIRYYWIFTPPSNCPTAEAMLTKGAGGRTSDWLRVFANTFAWLAEPSMKTGMGGAATPEAVVNPPKGVLPKVGFNDWTKYTPQGNSGQYAGLVGARTELSGGKGTVADYVKAAKEAHLSFLVFLEDGLRMNQEKWDKLTAACAAARTGDGFEAIPGLTFEDAQGDHMYAFSDSVKFPKASMLLPDNRLATTKEMRSQAWFDYNNEYMEQKAMTGFWNHRKNWVAVADYKLYNSFPVYSFEDGKPVDDALGDYLYLNGLGGCQAALALEIMTSPEQVAKRAKDGWRVVTTRPGSVLRTDWHGGAWSFSGCGSQYITNGPSILAWGAPNALVGTNGDWWRPDWWEWRVFFRAASDAGIKSVTLWDGDRGPMRRYLANGAKEFERDIILSHSQQAAPLVVVEDVNGRRAISMAWWSRNLMKEEFYCSDRCNFLGNSRLATRDGQEVWTAVGFQANMGITPSKGEMHMEVYPAVNLTFDSPTLPIDGAPAGLPTCMLLFRPQIPGELEDVFSYPHHYLIGAEIAVGQMDYKLAYDPAEKGAKKTPLGHEYVQPQAGAGNAWGSWHRLVPTAKAEGYLRTWAWNCCPGEFRIGWHEAELTMKEEVRWPRRSVGEGPNAFSVMYTTGGWKFYRDGKVIATPGKGTPDIDFTRGTVGVLEHAAGSVVIVPMEGPLKVRYSMDGSFWLGYAPPEGKLAKGEKVRYEVGFAGAPGGTSEAQLVEFAEKFGVLKPGKVGYDAKFVSGKPMDNYLALRAQAQDGAVEAKIGKADMPGFLPVIVEGLNDNWSVQMLDKARKWPNHRALPIRDGKAYAMLDLTTANMDVFIGHPVTCDNRELKLQVSWKSPGAWYVEAHNPTDAPVKANLASAAGWTPFKLKETVELAAGTSKVFDVREAP